MNMLANRVRTPVKAASPEQRPKTSYHEIEAKTILNKVRGMPFDWSISPYRGCIHGCTYCYARESHTYLGYNNNADFEHEIVVKTNAAELLQYEIQHPRMRNQTIVTGTISDPYQPAEAKYRLTRRMLEILLKSGNPVSVTTKSSLILRDLELLSQLANGPGCSVNMTITTMDRGIARKLEPRAPSPAQRLNAVRQLAHCGVRVGVFVGPVFPGLTDTPTQLEQLAESVADAGGSFLIGLPLRIGAGFAEPFLNATDRDFPEVASNFRRQARGNGMDKAQVARLSATFDELRFRFGLGSRIVQQTPSLSQPSQLTLPL